MTLELLSLFLLFARIGLLTIGGGIAMIPLAQQRLIQEGLMLPTEASDMIAISQMTPGPFAVNAATFAGMRLYGFSGALVATLGVVMPSVVLTMAVARFFYSYAGAPPVKAALNGARNVVVALIAAAVWSVGSGTLLYGVALQQILSFAICLLSFAAIYTKKLSPAVCLLIGGAAGALFLRG